MHSTTVNLVEPSLLKAVARVVARAAVARAAVARVVEAVKEVEAKVAGPHRHHLVLERVALIGRIATNLH